MAESVAGIPKGESPQSEASRSLCLSKPPCAQIPSFPSEVPTEAALRLHKRRLSREAPLPLTVLMRALGLFGALVLKDFLSFEM